MGRYGGVFLMQGGEFHGGEEMLSIYLLTYHRTFDLATAVLDLASAGSYNLYR